MKLCICGSRRASIVPVQHIVDRSGFFGITEVVSGGAPGVDEAGARWARGKHLPVKRFPANWDKHGKAAGPIRNEQMAEYADAAICVFLNGESRGTADMLARIRAKGKRVYVFYLEDGLNDKEET